MDSEREDALHEAWLDAALLGEVEDPASFCARHGVEGGDLLDRLERLRAQIPKPLAPDGERFGDFRLVERLGAGGMGVVWRATQESLDRPAAIKVLRPELAASPSARERFRQEAASLARLRHPHVVGIYDFGVQDERSWIAMELVPGRDLAERLSGRNGEGEELSRDRLVKWFQQVAEALAAAHTAGIVHRDVKPSNIRITVDDEARLVDFGLARDLDATLSLAGSFTGSPTYASPEQWSQDGAPIGPASDVWSLGVALYEALCGRLPFEGRSVQALSRAILESDPPAPRSLDPTLPRDLEVVVQRCLEKDPARRYPSGAELARDLKAVRELRPVQARPIGPLRRALRWSRRHRRTAAAMAVLLLSALGITTYHLWQRAAARAVRESEAAGLVARCLGTLRECETTRQLLHSIETETQRLERERELRFLAPSEEERLLRFRRDAERARLDLLNATDDVREKLGSAERLHADSPALPEAWLAWWFEKWAQSAETEDRATAIHFRDLVLENDPDGPLAARVLGRTEIELSSDPPGAEVWFFRMHQARHFADHREERWVPAPHRRVASEIPPGAAALRVVGSNSGTLSAGDLIVGVAGRKLTAAPGALVDAAERVRRGGLEVLAWTNGRTRTVKLKTGIETRPTRAPLPIGPDSFFGRTPLSAPLLPGDYIGVIRHPDSVSRRMILNIPHSGVRPGTPSVRKHVRLLPRDRARPGFVWVACDDPECGEVSFWIMEREVTCREYLAFLHAVATDPEKAEELTPHRDSAAGTPGVVRWPRSPDGGFRLPEGCDPEWPALGISAENAMAYARWMNRTTGMEAHGWEFVLPDEPQWIRASGFVRDWVFGRAFSPKWVASRYSTPRPTPTPVLRHPIDESRWGVFDLAGGAAEWLRTTRDVGRHREQALAGGSWEDADPAAFRALALRWDRPDTPLSAAGFRLVLQPKSK